MRMRWGLTLPFAGILLACSGFFGRLGWGARVDPTIHDDAPA